MSGLDDFSDAWTDGDDSSGLSENEDKVDWNGKDKEDTFLDRQSSQDQVIVNPRAYQLEMFEESLQHNIIVSMDTGSGKTQVAVLRIRAELEHAPVDKIVWFLAPTVFLCAQQYAVLSSQIAAVQMKCLSGADNIDKWTDQSLWDAVLKNVRVVVSTHQVLYDALTHAFVQFETLALLVFDEAHHCVKKHPGSKIMQDFYHPRLRQNLSVPCILGLSASPIMKSTIKSLDDIEQTLNSKCRTPNKHRAELLTFIKMPELVPVIYHESSSTIEITDYPTSLRSLHDIYRELNILYDPYVIGLRADNTEKSRRQLEKALMTQKTWCRDQLKSFCQTSRHIFNELGSWAVDYYIAEVICRYTQLLNSNSDYVSSWTSTEKQYLAETLTRVDISGITFPDVISQPTISDKVSKFIQALPREQDSVGIVFAQQRATVAVLAHLLSIHPFTRSQIRVGTVAGASINHQRNTSLGDLIDIKQQQNILEKFRSGELDLVIATSVLEEGIDIPACNFVMCFDEPSNVKSFVQRRGRARMRESRLILMQPQQTDKKIRGWQELESEMKKKYADDIREVQLVAELEQLEGHDGREFRIKTTGALLNLDNAMSHLNHFCAVLPRNQYVDLRPEFIMTPGKLARVLLPLCVDEAVRITEAKSIWLSERNAMKDAAFEAYLALYRAGLVNDNLMPLIGRGDVAEELESALEKRPSVIEIGPQLTPWLEISQSWTTLSNDMDTQLWKADLTLQNASHKSIALLEIMLPTILLDLPPIRLYWDSKTELIVVASKFSPLQRDPYLSLFNVHSQAQKKCHDLFISVFGTRFTIKDLDFVVPFMSISSKADSLSRSSEQPVMDLRQLEQTNSTRILIRDVSTNIAYIFKELLDFKPAQSESVKHLQKEFLENEEKLSYVALTKLPRRIQYLHKLSDNARGKSITYVLPAYRCTVDQLPFEDMQFTLVIPSIMRAYELFLVAQKLTKTLLCDVNYTDISLLLNAITAPSAGERLDYQRLEFLGDCVLKTFTSLQLMADNPLWTERYLSAKKDKIVANLRLARAALQVGLDKYIVTQSFNGRKWRPLYVQDQLSELKSATTRQISSKVLADVVEALIGAAEVDGGISKPLACLRIFIPEVKWQTLEDSRAAIYKVTPDDTSLPPYLQPLEDLIGYKFMKPTLLVEAMTHSSCNTGRGSYERLEFLGDAILDNIVVHALYGPYQELSHVELHHLRTALVNADFLAFKCLEWAIEQESGEVVSCSTMNTLTNANGPAFKPSLSTISIPLWKFMRHSSTKLGIAQRETSERHLALREIINEDIKSGSHYPWALLSRLNAPKFYSDIVESLLGAVYIDAGSFEPCERIIERMGITTYMRRIIGQKVNIFHPKEELGILAVTEKVRYVIELKKEITATVERREYKCEVFIGNRRITVVGGGVSKEEVQTKAAEAAVQILNAGGIRGGGRAGLDQEMF